MPNQKERGYAVAYCKCKRKCGEKEEGGSCDVSYKLTVQKEPDSEDDEVEVEWQQTNGSIWESHAKGKVAFWKNKLHGPEREKVKQKLRTCNTTIAQFAKESAREAEAQSALETGNLSAVVSEAAARHMVRELEVAGQLHENSFLELHQLQQGWEQTEKEEAGEDVPAYRLFGFIRSLSLIPFNVMLFSEQSVRLAKDIVHSMKKRKPGWESVMHIDASGGVSKGVGTGKDPYLYVLILRCQDPNLNLSSPIAYMLSERHDTEAVRHWISSFFSQIAKRCPGDWDWSPTIAVSDMSLPILRAESLALNGLPLYRYMSWCYKVAVEEKCSSAEIKEHTMLRVCSFHTLKNFPFTAGKTKDARKLNHEARIMVGKILMAESIQRLRVLLESFCLVFWSEKYTEGVEAALGEFEVLSTLPTSMLEEVGAMESAEEAAALAASLVDIVGAQPLSGSDWDEDKPPQAPTSIHLAQYFEKPPFRDEADEEKQDVEWTAKTQRERSAWFRDLDGYCKRGKTRAQELDQSPAGRVKEDNPYHLPALVRHLGKDFIANAPLLTCVMEKPLRYAFDVSDKTKPILSGLVTPVTNNPAEGSFSNIKRLETARDRNAVQVIGRRKGKLRPAALVSNLYDTHKNNFSAASQVWKTGGQGPLHTLVPNKRKTKSKKTEEEEESEDEDEAEQEVGEDTATETWAKKTPSKTPKKTPSKFLSPERKLSLLSPTKKVQDKKGGERKTKAQRRLDLEPRRLRARPQLQQDAAESRAEAAEFHGDTWKTLQDTLGMDSERKNIDSAAGPADLVSPPRLRPRRTRQTAEAAGAEARAASALAKEKEESERKLAQALRSVPGADAAEGTGPGLGPSPSPPVLIRVPTEQLSDLDDDDVMLATPTKKRERRRHRDRTPESSWHPDRFDQLSYIQNKVFPAYPKRFLNNLPPTPDRIFANSVPNRTRRAAIEPERVWQGRYAAPPKHKETGLVYMVWGVNKPGPMDSRRFPATDTCPFDNEVALWDRYERISGGAVSAFFNSIGRKNLAKAIKLIALTDDRHWHGVDEYRREMGDLLEVKRGEESGKHSMWASHHNAFLAQFGGCAGITFSIACECKTTFKRPALLELQASPHALSPLQDQLAALINLNTPFWQSCTDCGTGFRKLDIYQSNPQSFLVAVEVHGGQIGETGDEVATSWLRTLDELPRVLKLPGSRSRIDDNVFYLECLVLYTNKNHYQMVVMDTDGDPAFIHDDLSTPHIRRFNASDLLARLAEGLDSTREPTIAPSIAYYMRQIKKPVTGIGVVPSASFESSATTATRARNIPRKFADQKEDY